MVSLLQESCEDHIAEKHPEWLIDHDDELGTKSQAGSTSPLPLSPAQNRSITAADDNTEDLDEAETTKSSTRYLSPGSTGL